MSLRYILVWFVGSFVFSFLLTRLAVHFSRRFRLPPNGIPSSGGIPIAVIFLLNCIVFSRDVAPWFGVFGLAAAIIFLMGIVDDVRELSVRAKFFFQLIAALLVMAGGVRTQIVFLGPVLNFVVTLLWIVGITNAFNLLDIADGLAGGCALIVCAGLSVIVFLGGGQVFPAYTLIAMGGALCGFLIFNWPPAKVYLGNSGSHFLGFVISVLAITISYATVDREMALFAPVIILGFPIFDTMFLIFLRLSRWKLPFYKTKDHIAMRLRVLGYRQTSVLAIMALVCLLFVTGGVLVCHVPNSTGALIIAVLAFVAFALAKRTLAAIVHD